MIRILNLLGETQNRSLKNRLVVIVRKFIVLNIFLLPLVFHLSSSPALAVDFSPPAFIQWFESSYQTIENRIPDMQAAGYGQVWLPPPGRADSSNFSVGYDVYDRFDLGSPGNFTLYGSETGLKAVSRLLHRGGKDLYIDFIINHNGFSDLGTPGFNDSGGYPGFYLTHPNAIDGDFNSSFDFGDLRGRLAGLIDIDHATNFQAIRHPVPGFNNLPAGTIESNGRLANVPDENNRRFYPDRNLNPISVFDPQTGESDIEIFPFNLGSPLAGDPTEENVTGLLMRYAQWMVQVVGVDGFRIDAAKHIEGFSLDFFDRAVYRSSFRPHLDGSQRDIFSFSEVFDGDKNFQQTFIRKDINHSNPGVIGGNRDVLDFPLYFAMKANLSKNGFGNDWRNMVNSSMDFHDDGLHNGSQGVMFVRSHDDFGPDLGNVAHAYMLMHPGNAVVYFNAKEFGDNRDFPKDGRGDALGGTFGDQLKTLVQIRNTHGRGNYRERWIDKDSHAFERSNSALVLLSNRNDSGFDEETLDVDFAFGTYLIELTGNAKNDPDIPEVLQVFDDCFECQTKVNIRFLRNGGSNKGYLVYGLPTPQAPAGIEITNVDSVLSDPDPTGSTNGTTRLTDLHVIKTDSFQVSLQTVEVNLLGSIRDAAADGDNALIKIDGGRDINSNPGVDFPHPDQNVVYGFEQFTTKSSPLWTGGDGEYVQQIDTTNLSEGVHFLEVRAFRHRDDGGPAVFSMFTKAIYIDRLAPDSDLDSFNPINAEQNENRRVVVRSLDQTADNVHVFLDLPAALSDAQVQAMVGGGSQSNKIDRDLFTFNLFGLTHGNHVVTIVTFETTGTVNVQRFAGQFTSTIGGAGLGDINTNNSFEPTDVNDFETVLYSQNSTFSPPADINGDGLVDNVDLYQLQNILETAGASQATLDEYAAALLRRGDLNASGITDAEDIDFLRASLSSTDWLFDFNSDGVVNQDDVTTMIDSIFQTNFGDITLDGITDNADLQRLLENYGTQGGWADGDLSGDGLISLNDLLLLKKNYGNQGASSPLATAVPEPNSLSILLLGLFSIAFYLRKSARKVFR